MSDADPKLLALGYAAVMAGLLSLRTRQREMHAHHITKKVFVTGLSIYPCKSMKAVNVQSATTDELGFRGDRRLMVVGDEQRCRCAASCAAILRSNTAYLGLGPKLTHCPPFARMISQRQNPKVALISAKWNADLTGKDASTTTMHARLLTCAL
jgi:uncharacterized protein YcbX